MLPKIAKFVAVLSGTVSVIKRVLQTRIKTTAVQCNCARIVDWNVVPGNLDSMIHRSIDQQKLVATLSRFRQIVDDSLVRIRPVIELNVYVVGSNFVPGD